MSLSQINKVFQCDLTQRQFALLMAMADYADDDGTSVYPSIDRLEYKSNMSRSSVQRTIRELEQLGIIESVGSTAGGRGVTREWVLYLDRAPQKPPFNEWRTARRQALKGVNGTPFSKPENSIRLTPFGEKGCQGEHERVSGETQKGVRTNVPLHIEPSGTVIEPSEERARRAPASSSVEKAASFIVQVRGMERVSTEAVVAHLESIFLDLGRRPSDLMIESQGLAFRERWNAKRANQRRGVAWRTWRVALTNFYTRDWVYQDTGPRAPVPRAGKPTNVSQSLSAVRNVAAALRERESGRGGR